MPKGDHRIVVETVNLTKIFKDFWGRDKVKAVNELTLQIHRGEVFGLLGPNGSGKTTTIKMLLGLLYPTAGGAWVFGQNPSNVDVKAQIGYLPEETRLYQFLDSWETLDFYGRLFKLAGAERTRRAEALVEMVGLGPAATRPVGQYSKGMARRIGLAQSLINDPDLLILDEPTAGMDPIGTRSIKDLILELRKRGKTILLSSHLLADVEDVCDRVAIMYGGRLLCCGDVEDLLSQQQVTQVLAEKLDEKQIDELTRYISERFGRSTLSVGTPRHRLEQFFLSTVERAEEELSTSGSVGGGAVSEFLRARSAEGMELLDKLTQPVEPSKPAEDAEVIERRARRIEEQAVREQVLGDLTKDRSGEASTDSESVSERAVEEITPPSTGQVDRSVLDELTDRSDVDGQRRDSDHREG